MPDGEFELAQANLRANVLAGLGGTFALHRHPGHEPAADHAGALERLGSSAANTPRPARARRATTRRTAATCGRTPRSSARWIRSTRTRAALPATCTCRTSTLVPTGMSTRFFNNAMAADPARYPSNYWALNPQLTQRERADQQRQQAVRTTSSSCRCGAGWPQGLAAQVGYTWQRSFSGSLQDFHLDRFYLRSTGIPHAIQTLWTYDIPVGRGKRYRREHERVGGCAHRRLDVLRHGPLPAPVLRPAQRRARGHDDR